MFQKDASTVLTLLALLGATPAGYAQGLETLGNRAAALSAFVAVADDASAVAWNPAGLVLGPIFNVSLDLGRTTNDPGGVPQANAHAGRIGTTLVALGVPPLGLTYYRIASTAMSTASEVPAAPGRQERQVVLRTLVTSHLGATVLQSLGEYLTVGATLKLVRGSVGADRVSVQTWEEGFDRAERLDEDGSTTGDLDVGAMFAAGRVRAGLVLRNVTTPAFAAGDAGSVAMTLERHARVGVAWGDRWPGLARTLVAIDTDVTRVRHATGERRDIAAGVERWLRGQQIGIRGGMRTSTVGEARPVVSGGVSYAVRAGAYVDAYIARGSRDDRGWGVAARLAY
jgi:hypothetical protein